MKSTRYSALCDDLLGKVRSFKVRRHTMTIELQALNVAHQLQHLKALEGISHACCLFFGHSILNASTLVFHQKCQAVGKSQIKTLFAPRRMVPKTGVNEYTDGWTELQSYQDRQQNEIYNTDFCNHQYIPATTTVATAS